MSSFTTFAAFKSLQRVTVVDTYVDLFDAVAPFQGGFPFQRVRFKDVDPGRCEIVG